MIFDLLLKVTLQVTSQLCGSSKASLKATAELVDYAGFLGAFM